MPYKYCGACSGEMDDWREAYLGCKQCGKQDLDTEEALHELLHEFDSLKDEVIALRKLVGQRGDNHATC